MIEIASTVAFQMSLLLFVALGGYLLAMRLNQSAVVGVILAGILIGPSVLGLITYTEFVQSIAELGAIVLLFVVGLEFKLEDIIKPRYFIIGLSGVIVPWIAGFFLSELWGFDFAASVLIGTALTATSIAITANVLREMGKLKTEAAKAIIGAAVIDDVLGLLVLSIATNAIEGTISTSAIFWVGAKSILFLILGTIVGYFFVSKLVLRLDRSKIAEKYPEFIFMFALMFAFSYALISETIGLSAIIGAFLAGVSLEGITLRKSRSYQEGTEYLYIVFASIFFVSLGILVDFHALTWGILLFMLVLTAIAVLSKVVACGLPGLFQGLNIKDSLALGFGMVPRGEVAMIVALIGLNGNFIGQDVYVSLVLMSIFTTVLTPIVLKNWIYQEERRLQLIIRKGRITIK